MAVQATRSQASAALGQSPPAGSTFTPDFIVLLVVWFLLGLAVAPGRPLLPVYVESALKLPPLFTSTLLALQLAAGAIGAIVGGSIADLLGRKTALLLGSVSGPLAALMFLTHSPWFMVALAVVGGLLSSVQTIGGQTYLMNAVRQVKLGSAAALFFIGNTLGSSIGNIVAGKILDNTGFATVAVLMLLASGVVMAFAAWRLPWQKHIRTAGAGSLSGATRSYGRIIQRHDVQLLIGLRLLPTCYWGVATLLIPLLLYRASGEASTAAYYSGISLALAASCQLLTGRIADHIGRRGPVIVLTTLIAIVAIGTGFAAHSVAGLYIFGILGACSAWSLSTLMPGLIKDVSAPGEEGRTLALTHMVWSTAMLTGSLLGGWLVAVDATIPFLVTGTLNIAAILFAVMLWRLGQRVAS